MKNIIKIHKTLSLIITIPVILWTLSGLLHPVMGWFKPTVANPFMKTTAAEQSDFAYKLNKDSLLIKLMAIGLNNFQELRYITLNKKAFIQIHQDIRGNAIYYDIKDNRFVDSFDTNYASHLANLITKRKDQDIKSVDFIQNFSTEYKSVNQILPVHRVEYQDGLAVFIENRTDRFVTVVDALQRNFNLLFELFHNFHFIPKSIRFVGICLFMITVFTTAFLGFYLSRKIKRKKNTVVNNMKRFYHQKIAVFFSISLLAFSFSGFYHAFKKQDAVDRLSFIDDSAIFVDSLKTIVFPNQKPDKMSLKSFNGQTKWVKRAYSKVEFYDQNMSLDTISTDLDYVKDLAKKLYGKGNAINETQSITKFKGEYGFINKRLPVYKVQFSDDLNTRLYLEAKTGQLAAWINDSDALEGLSFAYLHKYHFFDFLGKHLRNVVMMLFALGNLLIIFTGLRILFK